MTGPRSTELTVLYDGQCSICRGSIARLQRFNTRQRIETLDLHDPSVPSRFPQVDPEIAMRWMQAVDSRGNVFNGVDAWARAAMLLPGYNLVAWLLLVPGLHWIAAKVYGWVARNRYRWNRQVCEDSSCAVHLPPTQKKL